MFCSLSKAFVAVLGLDALNSALADPIKVIDQDWADPSILLQDGTWYSYATGTAGKKVQVASTCYGSSWTWVACLGDWVTPDGAPTKILDRDDNDGPLTEAPSLNLRDGTYYLFFSSNCYSTRDYDVSYATAKTVNAMYDKAHDPITPLSKSGDFGLSGPGGADVNQHGNNIAFHANLVGDDAANRGMWVATIEENNGEFRIV